VPILDVEVVLCPEESLPPDFAARLADCAGEIFDQTPCTTWVKLHILPADCFAENCGGPLPDNFPVFVSVLMMDMPPRKKLDPMVNRLKLVVAALSGRQAINVHVFFLPEGAGRVYMGGRMQSRS
jgi:hypothetical protein